ncbi:hypothetical protein CYMTET_19083 [Cymbomonas tetramitiformis]|uniref:Uncharacterized protein n=1 Tax=Cymbomonas tetramitiformis TaxID=36881 RepID=A0AAE0G812_9CHLO|nr:hypothetical protein CYMTET_19083 [Cymbomonas tetramitiformis]
MATEEAAASEGAEGSSLHGGCWRLLTTTILLSKELPVMNAWEALVMHDECGKAVFDYFDSMGLDTNSTFLENAEACATYEDFTGEDRQRLGANPLGGGAGSIFVPWQRLRLWQKHRAPQQVANALPPVFPQRVS